MTPEDDNATTETSAMPSRVLVVGDDPTLPKRVEQAMKLAGASASVESTDDPLVALGQMAGKPAPDVVVIRLDAARDDLKAASEALRQLAVDARVVALLSRQDATSLNGSGLPVDEWLVEPVDSMAIHRAIVRPTPPQTETATGSEASSPPAEATEDLGDVDLVERLLESDGGLQETALQIIRTQAGMPEAGYVPEPKEAPAGHAGAIVQRGSQVFGTLHAPLPATSEQLAPWAGWLSRWLALEQRLTSVWEMALRDDLTGAWNRRYFDRALRHTLQRARNERFSVTLLVFDIDDFKVYNDKYGHAAGDEILRETARLMQSVVRDHDVVARIGGDEFAVIFWDAEGPRKPNSTHPSDVTKAAERFQRAICNHRFPKLLEEAPSTLTISGGLAGYPWDGSSVEELMEKADQMALQSKRQGKNAITFGPGAIRNGCGG